MLADNLKRYRELNNLSQEEVANAVGITQGAYGFFERGLKTPSLSTVVELAKLFNVTVDELIK